MRAAQRPAFSRRPWSTPSIDRDGSHKIARVQKRPNRAGRLELPRPRAVAPHQRNPYAIPAIANRVLYHHG
jgi:hypothetical protein